jgi:hypothetical protein
VRALLDLGANPWVNLLVGAAICLSFAASAIPTVLAERNRVPSALAAVHLVGRDDGFWVRFLVLDGDGRTLPAEGTLSVDLYAMRPDWSSGAAAQPQKVGTFERPVRYGDFRLVSTGGTAADGGAGRASFLMGESGPFTLAGAPGETLARTPRAAVSATVRLLAASGRRMGETTPWEDAAQVMGGAPAPAR